MRPRQGPWRLIVDQCDGLCPLPPRGLRPVEPQRLHRLVLCRYPALFHQVGRLGKGRPAPARHRRTPDDHRKQISRSPARSLAPGRRTGGLFAHRRLQRPPERRARHPAIDHPQRPALQRGGRLSAPRHETLEPDGHHQCDGPPGRDGGHEGRRRRIFDRREKHHHRPRRARRPICSAPGSRPKCPDR